MSDSKTKLVPISKGTVPIGGYFRYRDPDAGFEVAHPYYEWCKTYAETERLKRKLPLPPNWDAVFDAGMCAATPQACREIPQGPTEGPPSLMKMAMQFATAVTGWIASGAKVVSFETLKDRQEWCAGSDTRPRCPYFGRFPVFGLTKCGRCGCSGLKLFMDAPNIKCPDGKW